MKKDPLDQIFNIIDFSKTKKWSERIKRGGGYYKKIKKIRKLLDLVSKNDTLNMLKSILNDNEKNELNKTVFDTLSSMKEIYKNTKKREKKNIVYLLKRAKLSLRKARQIGFKVSSNLWSNCEKKNYRKPGKKKLSKELVREINDHCENLSEIASNRTIKIDKEDVNVRYLKMSIREAYNLFKKKNEVKLSTFYSYVGREFKKPFRLTDLCEYCELGRVLKRDIIDLGKSFNIDFTSNIYVDQNEISFSKLTLGKVSKKIRALEIDNEEKNKYLDKINKLEYIEYHNKIAFRQRNCYKNMLIDEKLFDNSILIEMDYKQKIKIGLSPRQVSGEYYNQKKRNLLGFGVYYKNQNEKIECINYDLIFEGAQDASTTVEGFKFLRSQDFFKKIEKNNYIIWSDSGLHFKCSQVVGFLAQLTKENINVNINYFGEKHGKSFRDQHFSTVSNYIKRESLSKQLTCTEDIIEAINKRQIISNEFRVKKKVKGVNLIPLNVIAQELKIGRNEKTTFKIIKNIKNYYNFNAKCENNELKSSIFSDEKQSYSLSFEKNEKESNEVSIGFETIVENNEVSLNTIISKKKFIDSILNSKPLKYIKGKKKSCLNCSSICRYTIKDLTDKCNINSKNIKEELKSHSHPKSRRIKNEQRNSKQALEELIEHYKYAHLNKLNLEV